MAVPRSPEAYYAARVRDAQPSPTIAVSEAARVLQAQGIDVIDLGGGDPDFTTPVHIQEAAIESMNAGDTHYVAGAGTPAFRQAIAAKLKQDNGVEVRANGGVMVTPGGKFALFLAAQAFVEPGVDVLILEPAWVSYAPIVELSGGRPVPVSLDPDDGFAITRDILEASATSDSRIIMLNSPNNPTGRVMTRDEVDTLAAFCLDHDLMVWTDEMYEKILYDDHTHYSIATWPGMAERTLTFNGLSKAYAMTGWRLGYVAGDPAFISRMLTVNSHAVTCVTAFAQAGGVAALNGPQEMIHEMVNAWDRRRHLVTDGINRIRGLRTALVEGAFYSFIDARELDGDSVRLADRILNEVHVGVVPGVAFGQAGEGHLRISFATNDDALTNALARLEKLFGSR